MTETIWSITRVISPSLEGGRSIFLDVHASRPLKIREALELAAAINEQVEQLKTEQGVCV